MFCKCLQNSIIALAIPLTPPIVALCLMVFSSVFQIVTVFKVKFTGKIYKFSQTFSTLTQAALHIFILSLLVMKKDNYDAAIFSYIGYVVIGLVCINILNDLLVVVGDVCVMFFRWIKQICHNSFFK